MTADSKRLPANEGRHDAESSAQGHLAANGTRPLGGTAAWLALLIGLTTVVCCFSLVVTARYQPEIGFDRAHLISALIWVAAFWFVSFLFVFGRFSFGYFIGFYCYILILGFLWLSNFSKFHYDYRMAAFSAAASGLLFLLPAVGITTPAKPVAALTKPGLERLLAGIMLLSLATIAVAAGYNFRLATVDHIYDFRSDIHFPSIVRYLIGAVSSVLLPFAFACYVSIGRRWLAGAALLLMLPLYPITLSKFALFAPAWVIVVWMLSRAFEARTTVILLALLPMLFGVLLISIYPYGHSYTLFNLINIRMHATTSGAMDLYNDFFARHPLTHFCQISFLKPFMSCPYQNPLGVVMDGAYHLGNVNASLFATEGVASVGHYFAPLMALIAGLIIAIGNRASAGLPPHFVLTSAALCPQILTNVPLTTALLTHGIALLFLLWYLVPREIFRSPSAGGGITV